MRLLCPEITWHGGEHGKNSPILSLDYHPRDPHLVVTAGSDSEVRMWHMDGESPPRFLFTLTGHESSINCVRWAPDGKSVASGADGGSIIWWALPPKGDHTSADMSWRRVSSDAELKKKVVVQHDDVYDLSWSPGGNLLAAGSVDHITCVWDVERRAIVTQFREHTHFVQGVAWDPLGQLLATQSSDRTVRVYGCKTEEKALERKRKQALNQGKPKPAPVLPGWPQGGGGADSAGLMKCARTLKHLAEPSPVNAEQGNATATKQANGVALALSQLQQQREQQQQAGAEGGSEGALPAAAVAAVVAEEGVAVVGEVAAAVAVATPKKPNKPMLFCDETVPSFFRRLDWTPDGAFLIAPTGIFKQDGKSEFTTWLFSRTQLDAPAVRLPGLDKPSVVARASPRLYKHRPSPAAAAAATAATSGEGNGGGAALPAGAGAATGGSAAAPLSGDAAAEATSTEAASMAMCDLPHRCVFAVLTLSEVAVYDTSQQAPLLVCKHLHYAALTDAAWSADGRCLAVSSSDGYVSVISFSEAEIGVCLDRKAVSEQWLPKSRVTPLPPPKTATPSAVASTSTATANNTIAPTAPTSTSAGTIKPEEQQAPLAAVATAAAPPPLASVPSTSTTPATGAIAAPRAPIPPPPTQSSLPAQNGAGVALCENVEEGDAGAGSGSPAKKSRTTMEEADTNALPQDNASPSSLPLSSSSSEGGFTSPPPSLVGSAAANPSSMSSSMSSSSVDLFSPPLHPPSSSPNTGGDAVAQGDNQPTAAAAPSAPVGLPTQAGVGTEGAAADIQAAGKKIKKRAALTFVRES